MHNSKIDLTKEFIQKQTIKQEDRFNSLMSTKVEAITDAFREKRQEQGLCKSCFYFKPVKLVMQAFWKQPCSICETEQVYHNSDTDALCLPCAKEQGLCKKCGAKDF